MLKFVVYLPFIVLKAGFNWVAKGAACCYWVGWQRFVTKLHPIWDGWDLKMHISKFVFIGIYCLPSCGGRPKWYALHPKSLWKNLSSWIFSYLGRADPLTGCVLHHALDMPLIQCHSFENSLLEIFWAKGHLEHRINYIAWPVCLCAHMWQSTAFKFLVLGLECLLMSLLCLQSLMNKNMSWKSEPFYFSSCLYHHIDSFYASWKSTWKKMVDLGNASW